MDEDRLAALLGSAPVTSRSLAGGCLFDVRRVELADGRAVVVKAGASEVAQHLRLEARMLADLARAGAPVPTALAVDDDLLVLPWIEHDGGRLDAVGKMALAETLARLHDQPAQGFGYGYPTVIGRLPQPNPPSPRWIPFFRDHRLLAQGEAAVRAGKLETRVGRRLEHLARRLDDLLVEPPRPSLLHGDLWAGNVLVRAGRPVAWIDPAIYHGDPEIELAFGTLFGPFDRAFLAAYAGTRVLAPGFQPTRRAIYTLYPLLVHCRLFGPTYGSAVSETLASLGF